MADGSGKEDALAPRWDSFARHYVQNGGSQSEAYLKAHPKARKWKPVSVHVAASRAMADAKVQLRIEQLQQEARERHQITVDTITAMLKDDRELARQNAQASAAISAVMGLAKVHGLRRAGSRRRLLGELR